MGLKEMSPKLPKTSHCTYVLSKLSEQNMHLMRNFGVGNGVYPTKIVSFEK